jgi:hypothetical protein
MEPIIVNKHLVDPVIDHLFKKHPDFNIRTETRFDSSSESYFQVIYINDKISINILLNLDMSITVMIDQVREHNGQLISIQSDWCLTNMQLDPPRLTHLTMINDTVCMSMSRYKVR